MTSAEVLEHLGVAETRELVIAINNPDATARATRAAQLAAPNLRITVRTAYDADVRRLEEAGATQVVTAEAAAADTIINRVLRNIDDSEFNRS